MAFGMNKKIATTLSMFQFSDKMNFVWYSQLHTSAAPRAALTSGEAVLQIDVDALPFTQVLPAELCCQALDDSEAFGTVGDRVVSQRLNPKFIVMFKQCLFHRSVLPCELPIATAQGCLLIR